jgi:hypothetical protein
MTQNNFVDSKHLAFSSLRNTTYWCGTYEETNYKHIDITPGSEFKVKPTFRRNLSLGILKSYAHIAW